MTYKVIVRPFAKVEILEAYDWYESQRAGLGEEFLRALDSFFDTLLLNPFTFSYYVDSVRSGKIKRFPYVVAYEVSGPDITILSVFMTYRDPSGRRMG